MPTPLNDAEIVEEFTRASPAADSLLIEVAQVDWQGTHAPVTSWATVTTLPIDASIESVNQARFALLTLRRYFRICRRCKERNPLGWMIEKGVCQSCAEKYYGVVF